MKVIAPQVQLTNIVLLFQLVLGRQVSKNFRHNCRKKSGIPNAVGYPQGYCLCRTTGSTTGDEAQLPRRLARGKAGDLPHTSLRVGCSPPGNRCLQWPLRQYGQFPLSHPLVVHAQAVDYSTQQEGNAKEQQQVVSLFQYQSLMVYQRPGLPKLATANPAII